MLNMAAFFSLTYLLFFLELAASSHFRGGIVQWRPLNNNPLSFNGQVSETIEYIIVQLLQQTLHHFSLL